MKMAADQTSPLNVIANFGFKALQFEFYVLSIILCYFHLHFGMLEAMLNSRKSADIYYQQ